MEVSELCLLTETFRRAAHQSCDIIVEKSAFNCTMHK